MCGNEPRADVTPLSGPGFGMQNGGIRSNRRAVSVYVLVEGATAANAVLGGMVLVAPGPSSWSTVVLPGPLLHAATGVALCARARWFVSSTNRCEVFLTEELR